MYLDLNNSTSFRLSNTYDKFSPNNQTVIWRSFPSNSNVTKPHKDDVTIKFVLKNDGTKVKKPVKVFSVPIYNKIGDKKNATTTNYSGPKKSFNTISEEHSVEYEDEEVQSFENIGHRHGHKKKGDKYSNKHKPMQGMKLCKSKRKVSHKLKKMGKFMLPAAMGFLAFKAILLPILLKLLAVISAKGLFLALVSFIMASLLSLKQIVGSTARHDTKKSAVTIVPFPVQETSHWHKHQKNDEQLEFEHNPYNAYVEGIVDENGLIKRF